MQAEIVISRENISPGYPPLQAYIFGRIARDMKINIS